MKIFQLAVLTVACLGAAHGHAQNIDSVYYPAQGKLVLPRLKVGTKLYYVILESKGDLDFRVQNSSITDLSLPAGFVPAAASDLVGKWTVGSTEVVFNADGTYSLTLRPGDNQNCPAGGLETGTYQYDSNTGVLMTVALTDTNGECGISHPNYGPGRFRKPSGGSGLSFIPYTASGKGDELVLQSGIRLFEQAFPGTNGRTCASCHVPEDNFTLTPDHVTRLYETNPNDPLFNAIDADDPKAATLTYEALKKGLIRVWLTLPNNMDLIDGDGKVITPADRKIWVWRSVPSIMDVAFTAPYQLDGQVAALEAQAQGALTGHSQGGPALASELKRIADFERDLFSSGRARSVAQYLARGIAPDAVPDVDAGMNLTPEEQRGREVYEAVCAACHGGATRNRIVDRAVHAMAFPVLKPDGTLLFEGTQTQPPGPGDQPSGPEDQSGSPFVPPVYADQPNNEFINIGSAYENYLAHSDATEHVSFTRDLYFPQYRFRFYKDASRKEVVADLPPKLPRHPENPDNPLFLVTDENGNFILGPNNGAQLYSTDPGRAAITGSPYDFEAFDIPTLRGIAKTAPYWHNNISETLEGVVELYSDHLLSKFPTLVQPGEKETDEGGDIGPEQTMTRQQKDDLLAYLQRL